MEFTLQRVKLTICELTGYRELGIARVGAKTKVMADLQKVGFCFVLINLKGTREIAIYVARLRLRTASAKDLAQVYSV